MFHLRFLTGDKPLLRLDDEFARNHKKVLLRSDTSDKTWKVNLDGDRLGEGWEDFAAVHKFKNGDVLVFKHDGNESFHVSVSSQTNTSNVHNTSPIHLDNDVTYIDDDDDDDDDDDRSEDDEGNISLKRHKKAKANSCFFRARVTPYSLLKDRLDLSRDFTVVSYDELKKPCEVDLVNEEGRKWRLLLSRNNTSGVFYIRRGWVNFCSDNDLSKGDFCMFKLVENGERPVLWLCSNEEEEEEEECTEAEISSVGGCSKEKTMLNEVSKRKAKKTNSPFLKIKLTQNRLMTGQLYISSVFVIENNIKPGEMILLNKDGRKWPACLQTTGRCGNEWFYLRKGWKQMCEANGVKVNDSFVLKLIWEDASPMFMFFSKVKSHENKGKKERRTPKKRAYETPIHEKTVYETPRVETEGQRGKIRVSNKPTTDSSNLHNKKPNSCSVSNQVANVKQSILDTLNTVRKFRAELEEREKNLEASLVETDALGKMVLGISQILNNNLV